MTPLSPTEATALLHQLIDAVAVLTLAPAPVEPDAPLLCTVADVATLLGCSADTAYDRMRAGWFGPVVRLDSKVRVTREGVTAWVTQQAGKEVVRHAKSVRQTGRDHGIRSEGRSGRAGDGGSERGAGAVALVPARRKGTHRHTLAG